MMSNTMKGIRKLAKQRFCHNKNSLRKTFPKRRNTASNSNIKPKSVKPQNDQLRHTLKKAGWSVVPYRFKKNQNTR